jgi:hypothetical protein
MRSVSHTDEGEPLGFQTFIESTSPFPPIDFSIGALEHHGPRLPHFRSDPFFGNETCCLPIYNADRPRRSVPDNIFRGSYRSGKIQESNSPFPSEHIVRGGLHSWSQSTLCQLKATGHTTGYRRRR